MCVCVCLCVTRMCVLVQWYIIFCSASMICSFLCLKHPSRLRKFLLQLQVSAFLFPAASSGPDSTHSHLLPYSLCVLQKPPVSNFYIVLHGISSRSQILAAGAHRCGVCNFLHFSVCPEQSGCPEHCPRSSAMRLLSMCFVAY